MNAGAGSVGTYLAEKKEAIDRRLDSLVPDPETWPVSIHRAIRHSLFAGGKRLRPILALAAAETLGGDLEATLPSACGLEMIHTYSLIHDDLPALDNDAWRRGVPTCHIAFGEATAILAGDALLTHGLGTIARYPEDLRYDRAKVRLLEAVVEAIGTGGMIGGQVADLEAERGRAAGLEESESIPGLEPANLDPAALLARIHESKTGRLIRASLAVGGYLAFAGEGDLEKLDRYGERIGLAFQIRDDLLDVESDRATLGKDTRKDAGAGKLTFPVVWGVGASREMLRKTVEDAIEAARELEGEGGLLARLARFVAERRS
jgi:geranylgeranyl diphosphate synthase, type II